MSTKSGYLLTLLIHSLFLLILVSCDRPNIILLLTDDQDVVIGGIDQMPYLNELMIEKGMQFTNAFVHTPLCCPSRSSILTGRYLHNGRFVNNSLSGNCNGPEWQTDAEKETFAVYAQASGYRTSYSGKYLNQYGVRGSKDCPEDAYPNSIGCNRVPSGWDKWLGLVGNSVYYNYTVVQSDDGGETSFRLSYGDSYENDYLPDLVSNRTIEMIEQFTTSNMNNNERQPFLIVNAWPSPHAPFTPAPWAEHLYDGIKAHRTANWNASDVYMKQKHWIMRQLAPIDNVTEDWIDTAFEQRLETLRSVDNHIKDIIQLLDRKGILDETILLYTSDNGFQLGQHRLQTDKRHLYEHDLRVPFIVVGPGIEQNTTETSIVLNIDISPTIHEIVTGSTKPIPENMDGMSIVPLLTKNAKRCNVSEHVREDFLISYNGEGFDDCGMAGCPPLPPSQYHGGPMPDSFNNTYHCVRTIRDTGSTMGSTLLHEETNTTSTIHPLNTIYCQFEDDEKFVEYYDLIIDPWQLVNRYHTIDESLRKQYERRLYQLLGCKGESCRTKMPPMNIFSSFSVD